MRRADNELAFLFSYRLEQIIQHLAFQIKGDLGLAIRNTRKINQPGESAESVGRMEDSAFQTALGGTGSCWAFHLNVGFTDTYSLSVGPQATPLADAATKTGW